MSLSPGIEITADGSATLRSPHHGDTYHSLRGAVGEARHVFIEAGFADICRTRSASRHCEPERRSNPEKAGLPCRLRLLAMTGIDSRPPVRVLEMGFGTGLNAWLTLEEAARTGQTVEYTAVELYPVPRETAVVLNYTSDPRFEALHTAPWGVRCEPSEGFGLLKLHGAITDILQNNDFSSSFDVVYWDAFAPDTQPGLWTAELFARVFEATAPGGILVTYSSKGDVRRALKAAGFEVEKLPGALGKRHMLRARKN